ncbi:MAG: M56 family metallopeptidase [Nitrospirota bacterium]
MTSFFASYPGMYIVQSFVHALVAALVVDRALQAWNIRDPLTRQRFRFLVVLLPLVLFPLYQWADPGRGSLSFRLGALFDSSRWLGLELWGTIPLSLLLLLVVSVTTLLFLFQELLPIIHHTFVTRRPGAARSSGSERADPAGETRLTAPAGGLTPGPLSMSLEEEAPPIELVESDELVLFSTTGKHAAVYISRGIIAALSPEEREVVVAHEVAHVVRNRRPLLVLVFLVRVLLFFNPVILLEFRRIVQEEEKICDDMAASMTRKPGVLAATLKKLYLDCGRSESTGPEKRVPVREALENYSHAVHIQSRVARLEQWQAEPRGGRWFPFAATFTAIAAINYFIV